MRLIDADVVEDTLKKCVNNAYKRRDTQCATGVSLAILQLRNIPTAYDVEKVESELEEETEVFTSFETMHIKYAIPKHKAIDIVKRGGVE